MSQKHEGPGSGTDDPDLTTNSLHETPPAGPGGRPARPLVGAPGTGDATDELTDSRQRALAAVGSLLKHEDLATMSMENQQSTAPTHYIAPSTRYLDDLQAGRQGNEHQLLYGHQVGGYRILEKIGGGGCGTVYAAEHTDTGALVAIKILHASLARDPAQIQRFVREAQTLARMQHSAIVCFHDNGFLDNGRPYLVMELLRGRNLAALLLEHGRYSPVDVLELLAPICEALTVAHGAGIIHRDIKASNVMVVDKGDRRQVKLFDFGIAKLTTDGSGSSMQTSIGHVMGTPHSMAPEQILGQPVDPRADVYALGVLIYRLLTGQYPFENGDALEVARMHLQSPPPRASQVAPVPPALDAVVLRAMEKQPESRYETPAALLAALRESITAPLECSRTSLPALAVYVEARIDSEKMPSDATLDDLVTVLDIAETMLTRNRFRVPIETSTALLGITMLPAPTHTLPASGTELARHLYKRLERRSGASKAIHINVCCHLDHVVVNFTSAEPVILGGPVLDVGTWAPRRDIHGPCATRSSMGEGGAGNSGSPHRLLDDPAG